MSQATEPLRLEAKKPRDVLLVGSAVMSTVPLFEEADVAALFCRLRRAGVERSS